MNRCSLLRQRHKENFYNKPYQLIAKHNLAMKQSSIVMNSRMIHIQPTKHGSTLQSCTIHSCAIHQAMQADHSLRTPQLAD